MFQEETMKKVAAWYSRKRNDRKQAARYASWLPGFHFGSVETLTARHVQTHDSVWIICCVLVLEDEDSRRKAVSSYSKTFRQAFSAHSIPYQQDGVARKIANNLLREQVTESLNQQKVGADECVLDAIQ